MGLVVATHCAALHVVSTAGGGGVGFGAWHPRRQHPSRLWGLSDGENEGTGSLVTYSQPPPVSPVLPPWLFLGPPRRSSCHHFFYLLFLRNSRLSTPSLSAI